MARQRIPIPGSVRASMSRLGRLELLGAIAALDRAIRIFNYVFPENVWNGRSCSECNVYGAGSSEPHTDNCPGIETMKDLIMLRDLLKKENQS